MLNRFIYFHYHHSGVIPNVGMLHLVFYTGTGFVPSTKYFSCYDCVFDFMFDIWLIIFMYAVSTVIQNDP